MENDLTEYQIAQLTLGGRCNLHQHETNLEHKHIDALQSLEVVTNTQVDHLVSYREDIITADTSAGSIVVTLPKSRGGKKFIVVKTSGLNTLTILFTGGETVLGSSSVITTALGDVKRFKGITGGYIPL